jgi:HAD superfamily hydrolase (TIGR01450 family)
MRRRLLSGKRLLLFDLDGVFYKGKEERVKIGGTAAVEAVRRTGKRLYILTNNSTDSVETIHSRLLEFDIPVRAEEILSSALLTAEYIQRRFGRVTYYLVGEKGLDAEMKKYGHRRSAGRKADLVVVGLDREVTYGKLDTAVRLVRAGAGLVATHSSKLYMYKTGPAIATGPIVKAIEYGSDRRATVVGKPSPLMFSIALTRAGCRKEDAVMIGDQVDTDVAGASRAGIDSILVTSGVDRSAKGYKPMAVVPNVDEIARML